MDLKLSTGFKQYRVNRPVPTKIRNVMGPDVAVSDTTPEHLVDVVDGRRKEVSPGCDFRGGSAAGVNALALGLDIRQTEGRKAKRAHKVLQVVAIAPIEARIFQRQLDVAVGQDVRDV